MALFSDMDWVILVGVGAFLLLGKENGAVLRQFGRYYGRLVRLKQDLMGEFAKAADLPAPSSGRPLSIRTALVQISEPSTGRTSGIPVYVSRPPVPLSATGSLTGPEGWAMGPGTWTLAAPAANPEELTR